MEVIEKGSRFRRMARGYGLGSGNSIPSYVPVEGFMALIEAARVIREQEQSESKTHGATTPSTPC
jgi:hypothetical protein